MAGRGRQTILAVMIEPDRVPSLRRVGDPLTARAARSEHLRRLLAEGPQCGIHLALIASGRRALSQVIAERQELPLLNHRVGTQMSETDSLDIFGTRKASQLKGEGGQAEAAMYFNNSSMETVKFRPFASLSANDTSNWAALANDLQRTRK